MAYFSLVGTEEFKEALTFWRERRRLKKNELARLAKISPSAISNWEGSRPNKRGVTPDDVKALADALEIADVILVRALGYRVSCPGIEGEEDFVQEYMRVPQDRRDVLRGWLELPPKQPSGRSP